MSITLTVGNKTIKTLSADGTTVLDTQVNPAVYQFASLGEFKCLEIDITLAAAETFLGSRILINPALFGFDGYQFDESSGNNTGWTYNVTAATATGTDYQMTLQNSSNAQTNINCLINFSAITPNPAATVKIYYYQTADTGDFLQSALYNSIDNARRLRAVSFPPLSSSLLGAGTSYKISANKYWGCYTYTDSALLCYIKVTDTATTLYGSTTIEIPYEANLDSVNFPNLTPDITNGTFALKLGAISVTKFQINTPTKVEITCKSTTAITNVLVWLIRSDRNDNGAVFIDNYEASFAEITTDGTTGTELQNAIISPSVAPTLLIGTTYRASFHVDPTKVEIGGLYKIVAVWYDTVNAKVNTYISSDYGTGGIKEYDDELIISSKIEDYNGVYLGNYFGCCPEERLKSVVNILYEANTNLFTPRITGMLNEISSHDLRDFLYKVEVTTFSIDGVNKHIYTRDSIDRKAGNTYNTPEYITITSPNFTKELNINYNFRVHHEQEMSCLESYVNNVKQAQPMVNLNWAGLTVYIEYKFYLQYQSRNPDVQDCLIYYQKLVVKKYENDLEPPKLRQTNDFDAVCYGSPYCPEFTIQNVYNPEDFRFIGTISKQNYSTNRKMQAGTELEFGCENNIGGTISSTTNEQQAITILSELANSSSYITKASESDLKILSLF